MLLHHELPTCWCSSESPECGWDPVPHPSALGCAWQACNAALNPLNGMVLEPPRSDESFTRKRSWERFLQDPNVNHCCCLFQPHNRG